MSAATALRLGVTTTLRETPLTVRYLLAGVMVNQLGAFTQAYLMLYLTHQGFSVGQASSALTVYSIGAVLGIMAGGESTARMGARTAIITGMTGSALALGLIPAVSTPGRFPVLMAVVALAGFAAQSYRPAAAVLLEDLMPAEHRVMAFSMFRIALNTGAALGPLIATALIPINWNTLFWFNACTASCCALIAWRRLPNVAAPVRADALVSQPESGYGAIVRDRRYLLFLTATFITALIWVQFLATLPLSSAAHGHSIALYSAMLTTASGILIAFELKVTAYVEHWRPNSAVALGIAIQGIGLITYALAGYGAAPIAIGTIVMVVGMMIQGPTMFAYPATFPTAVRARCVAVHQALFGAGQALGPALGVLAWQTTGQGVWLLCGILGMVGAWCAYAGMCTDTTGSATSAPTGHDRG
ncbi:MFS transporter [Nocardia sp. NBC_00881]|uniref:MFS transporter n=1 Tax=Nocardia sp. NBC_00881 TaxID=2975995 RepID=UPI003864C9C4|nr:MFS transporter [Nocardia sp. NBC_00881]